MESDYETPVTMEASTIVIKVKFGDVLRRFSSWISEDGLDVNMDGLKEKILSLFNFPPNSALLLTYVDEDGDEVTLVDDDDLRDIVKQALDPLRITVKLTAEENVRKYHSNGSSTPLKSPLARKPFQCSKTALEPLHETLVKLSTNLASKVSSSKPDIAELIDYFSKVSSSYLDYTSDSQPRMRTPTHNYFPGTTTADAALSKVRSNVGFEEFIKQNESLEKLEPLDTLLNNAVKHGDASIVDIRGFSAIAPGFHDVGLDSQTINAGQPVSDSLQNSGPPAKSRVVPSSIGEKEKFEQISKCCSKDKSSLRSSHLPSVANADRVAGMSNVSSNVPTEKATRPEPELDLANPSSKKNASASPLYPACSAVTFSGNSSQNDDLSQGQDFFCDGCGADPIFSLRFRSKVKEALSVFPERKMLVTIFE